MNAYDIQVRRRNGNNNGWEEVLIPAAAFQSLGFNQLKELSAGQQGRNATATAVSTAGAATYTSAAVLAGVIARDPAGSGRTDVTPTAELLIAAANAVGLLENDYDEVSCLIVNTADGNETITLNGGVGVTLQTAITIAQNSATRIAFLRTSATTLVCREV